MNATELFVASGNTAGIWYCGQCRIVATSQQLAEQCCQAYKCTRCGVDTGSRSWLVCDACRQKEEAAREQDRFAKAQKLTEFDGPVYLDGTGWNDGYSESLADFMEWLDDQQPEDRPQYVWACTSSPVISLDYDSIIEDHTQEAHENFDPMTLEGQEELKSALDAFNEANKKMTNWDPDYSRAVLIPAIEERMPHELGKVE